MKAPMLPAAWLLCAWSLVSGAAGANVVSLAITRRTGSAYTSSYERLKRSSIVENLDNFVSLYAANISIGTPPQSFEVIIDTGSSDTYVMAASANICLAGQCQGGTFDPTQSTSFKTLLKGGFSIKYQDKSGSSGDLITETLSISSGTVKGLEMGLAFKSSLGFGFIGIGFDTNESTDTQYLNLIDQLAAQGQIGAKAYSLYLDDINENTGSILFGGIDTAKFTGPLKVIPLQKDPRIDIYREFLVTLSSVAITDQSGKTTSVSSSSINGILDSGTTVTYLPSSTVANIVKLLSGVDDTKNSGSIYVDCDLLKTQSNAFITFGFGSNGGPQIKVPYSEMIIQAQLRISQPPFANTCILGILAAGSGGPYVFGDTFLRSAYVVYDLDHNQIGLAQTVFGVSASNIQELSKDATGIPSLTGGGSAAQTPSSSGTGINLPPSLITNLPPVSNGNPSATGQLSVSVQTTTAYVTVSQGGGGATAASASATKSAGAAAGPGITAPSAGMVFVVLSLMLCALGGGWMFL